MQIYSLRKLLNEIPGIWMRSRICQAIREIRRCMCLFGKQESIKSGAEAMGVSNSLILYNIRGNDFEIKCFKDTIENRIITLLTR